MATEYVVLRIDVADPAAGTDGLHRFELVADKSGTPMTVNAANDIAAIALAEKAAGASFEHGAVAIPARSWRLRKREVKRVERTLWS